METLKQIIISLQFLEESTLKHFNVLQLLFPRRSRCTEYAQDMKPRSNENLQILSPGCYRSKRRGGNKDAGLA